MRVLRFPLLLTTSAALVPWRTPRLPTPSASIDVIRKTLWAKENNQEVDLYSKLPADAYTSEFSGKSYDAFIQAIKDNFKTSDVVIVDATFIQSSGREAVQ